MKESKKGPVGLTIYPDGQMEHGPIDVSQVGQGPDPVGIVMQNGTLTCNRVVVHQLSSADELQQLYDRTKHKIVALTPQIASALGVKDTNGFVALEVMDKVNISREELEKVLAG